MKKYNKYTALLFCIFFVGTKAISQELLKHAPAGFDSVRANIPHGKIDTITYNSKTVGNNRQALIYTPPGYSKKEQVSRAVFAAWHWRR